MVFNVIIIAKDTTFICYESISQLPGLTVNPYSGVITIYGELTAENETAAKGMIATLEQSDYVDHITLGKVVEKEKHEQ